MILSVVLILLVGLIAYLHYIQGLLNGLISVVLALVATAVAIAEYEPMAAWVSGGKYNDQAQGVCLVALFALRRHAFSRPTAVICRTLAMRSPGLAAIIPSSYSVLS